jgi:hypothetical protein
MLLTIINEIRLIFPKKKRKEYHISQVFNKKEFGVCKIIISFFNESSSIYKININYILLSLRNYGREKAKVLNPFSLSYS